MTGKNSNYNDLEYMMANELLTHINKEDQNRKLSP